MILTLTRKLYRNDGIFSDLTDEDGKLIAVALEHAYEREKYPGLFLPKVRNGTYTCKREVHRLKNGVPFWTYEVEGVKGHAGIVFHPGNYNDDSHGCILLGDKIVSDRGTAMILNSKVTFDKLMERLGAAQEFTLKVIG